MSEDIKITLLLAQIKEDPRFLRATSNSVRATGASLENDPLVTGVSGGNEPLLFSTTSNTPNLFNIELDLFSILRLDIQESRFTIADFVEAFEQGRTLNTVSNILDIVNNKNLDKGKIQDTAALLDKAKLRAENNIFDLFSVSSSEEELSIGKNVLEVVNAEESVTKLFEILGLRTITSTRYTLLSLAESLARPGLKDWVVTKNGIVYNVFANNADPFYQGDNRWSGTDFQGRYRWVSRNSFVGHEIFNLFNSGEWYPASFLPGRTVKLFNPTTTGFTSWNGTALNTYLGSSGWDITSDQFPRPVEYKPAGSNTFYPLYPKWTVGENPVFHNQSEGYVYWWMPNYTDSASGWDSNKVNEGQLRAQNRGPAQSGKIAPPLGWFPVVRGDTGTNGYPNGTPTGGTPTIVDGPFGPAEETNRTPGELVSAEDLLHELKKRSFIRQQELVKVRDFTLHPKARLIREQIKALSSEQKKVENDKQFSSFSSDASDIDPDWRPHRRVEDNIDFVQLFLNPKARIRLDKIKSTTEENKTVEKDKILDVFDIASNLHQLKVDKEQEEQLFLQDFALSPKARIQMDNLTSSMQVKKLRTKGFDFDVFLRNEVQELHVEKGFIEDIENMAELVLAGKFLLHREKIDFIEEVKRRLPIINLNDDIDFEEVTTLLTEKGLLEDVENMAELVIAGKILTLRDRILSNIKVNKTAAKNDLKELIELTDKVEAKKLDILQDSESFYNAIAPLITTPAKFEFASTVINVLEFLKFDPNFGVESINIGFDDTYDELFTRKNNIHESIFIENLVLNPKARIQTDRFKLGQDLVDILANKGTISNIFKLDDTVHPLGASKGDLRDKADIIINALFSGKALLPTDIFTSFSEIDDRKLIKDAFSNIFKLDDTTHPIFTDKGLFANISLFQDRVLANNRFEFIREVLTFIDGDVELLPFVSITETGTDVKDFPSLQPRPKREFVDKFSANIKGVVFARDEEYTTGAYFLEPYVASTPPGRSRQF